jgi:hypothetical protein
VTVAVWAQSEQRVRAVGLHHHMVVHEGVFGRFTERLHPRSREGEFAAKPGGAVKLPKKRGPSGEKVRQNYEQRVLTPQGQKHLEHIRGKVATGEYGDPIPRHWNQRTVHTAAQQKEVDAQEAHHKAERDRRRQEDKDYESGVVKARMEHRRSLTGKERALHDEVEAALHELSKYGFEQHVPLEVRERLTKAKAALAAHEKVHGAKRPKYPEKPYRHVSEP